MSVETGGGAETGVGWGRPVPASRGLLGRRRILAPGISEVRGPAACMRRDAVFRRLLLVADVFAIVGAFVLTVEISSRSAACSRGPASRPCRCWSCAPSCTGLYDRDETLLRKTTLDEAPKLFQLATLSALVVWLDRRPARRRARSTAARRCSCGSRWPRC